MPNHDKEFGSNFIVEVGDHTVKKLNLLKCNLTLTDVLQLFRSCPKLAELRLMLFDNQVEMGKVQHRQIKLGNGNSSACRQVAQRLCSTACVQSKLVGVYRRWLFGEHYSFKKSFLNSKKIF